MILPAILETDPKKQLQRMEELSRFSNLLHTDIMDGKFVKKKNVKMLNVLAGQSCSVDWELHLMVEEPGKVYFAIRRIKNVKRVVLPIESNWRPSFAKYKKHYQVGIALKTETPVAVLSNYRHIGISFVQLLSVTPGAQGNSFHSNVYQRVRELKKMFPKMRIEIDGAMNPTRIRKLKALGANDFVVGSYLKEGNVARRAALLGGF